MKRLLSFVTVTIILLASCQAAFAGTSPAGYDAITLNEIKSSQFAPSPFRVSKDSEGTILLYKTNSGRYGKLLIRKYSSYKQTLTVLTINFTTYGSNGRVYKQGSNLTVSVQGCDLDTGRKTAGKNIDFKCAANLATPANGAVFALYKNPAFAVQGVKRTQIYSNRIQFAVQYYIPTTYQNPCMITAGIKGSGVSNFTCIPAGGRTPFGQIKSVPKGQHYFDDNVHFDIVYNGSRPYNSKEIEVQVFNAKTNKVLGSTVIRSNLTWNCSQCPRTHTYINNYPKDRETGWSENLQGVTHDERNWFFTQDAKLWKFPVEYDLNRRLPSSAIASLLLPAQDLNKFLPKGVHVVGVPDQLKGYNHFGDLDYYQGYLFAPIYKKHSSKTPYIAVFRASDLRYVSSAPVQSGAGWCAINPLNGLLYTSDSEVRTNGSKYRIYRYEIDFNKLRAKRRDFLKEYTRDRFSLSYKNGDPITLKSMQGGVFSKTGCFYTVNGYCEDTAGSETGIMVFDSRTGRRIARSKKGGSDPFKYEFHPGPKKVCKQEPEGITIWDVDLLRRQRRLYPPGITGQLHVIMLDNWPYSNEDDLYFKHYKIR
jgi:hypothetical protein